MGKVMVMNSFMIIIVMLLLVAMEFKSNKRKMFFHTFLAVIIDIGCSSLSHVCILLEFETTLQPTLYLFFKCHHAMMSACQPITKT
jgi:hypothetical protein